MICTFDSLSVCVCVSVRVGASRRGIKYVTAAVAAGRKGNESCAGRKETSVPFKVALVLT